MSTFLDVVHAFLRDATLSRREVERFIDPGSPAWARFDAELGYVPNDSRVPDGVDGAMSTYRYGAWGERVMINHADQPVRVNTYGDSMTQCHQVSDGETWQEALAAHIGEPIRNFGVGGYGVYQAYRRLLRTEATDAAAPCLILNIFLDDHYRSLDACRLLRVGRVWRDYDQSLTTSMFHMNPWTHLRFEADGSLVVRENICPTEDSLLNLCDTDFLIDTFAGDFVVRLLVAQATGDFAFLEEFRPHAEGLGVPLDLGEPAAARRSAARLYDTMAFRATTHILSQLRHELARAGKSLLVALSYPQEVVAQACHTPDARPDQEFVDALDAVGVPYVDILPAHIEDFAAFTITPDEYIQRLFIGHYTPAGNHFFAFRMKDAVVNWLNPRPPAYRDVEKSFAAQAARLA